MRLIILFLCCGVVAWFLSGKFEWFSEESNELVQRISGALEDSVNGGASKASSKPAVATMSFEYLPVRPELSAPIRLQSDYVLESMAYWCEQLVYSLGSEPTTKMKDLVAEISVYIQEHRSTLDLCYAKIKASEDTLMEMKSTGPEILKSRLDAIDFVKKDVMAAESFLAKVDTLIFAELSVVDLGAQSLEPRNARLRAELETLVHEASTLLQAN